MLLRDGRSLADLVALGAGGCDAGGIVQPLDNDAGVVPSKMTSHQRGWSPQHGDQHCGDSLSQRTPLEKELLFLGPAAVEPSRR